ncbi:MAG: hypothetical protein K1X83_09000 [Oligoflexia bacterium]|nr:hypothetical protein [Oligoflexia bacterium]
MAQIETTYRFLNGLQVPRAGWATRGLLMEQRPDLMPPHIEPLIQNEFWTVRQDAEFAVPGFYVVGARAQVLSIADLTAAQMTEFSTIIRAVREIMRSKLGIERVNIYLEEKLKEPHLHIWLVPMWPEIMEQHGIEPRLWEGNVRKYLELFKFEEEDQKILRFNRIMREALLEHSDLRELNFT